MDAARTRQQLFAAVDSGDARAVASFYADPNVSATFGDEGRLDHVWLLPFQPSQRHGATTSLLATAIDSNHADLIQWHFSADAVATIGPEPLCVVIATACHLALKRADALALLEQLVVSPVFTQTQLLYVATTVEAVQLLTAHGACVHTRLDRSPESTVLRQSARTGDLALIDAVVQAGALPIASCVLGNFSDHHALERLLTYGCHPVDVAVCFHHTVVSGLVQTARVWLECDFVDVDIRDLQGRTALMRVAWSENSTLSIDAGCRLATAKMLLAYGASVTAKDLDNKTPLQHAIASGSQAVVGLLIEHGVEPDKAANGDCIAIDFHA